MAESAEQKKTKGKGGKIAIFVILLIIVALLAVVIVLLLRGNEEEEEERRSVVVTQDNVQDVIDEMGMPTLETVPAGYYTATMNYEWHFATGAEASYDAYVQNLAENTNDVYFDIVMADDEENVIYKSPVIPIGESLENITLDTDLDAGTYDCVCIYHLVDDNQNTLSTLRVTVTIIVEG